MVWEESIVHDVRLSSVGPGQMSGSDVFHHPGGLDLAMKLHYLRVVYLFDSEASKDVTIMKIKDAMFSWFNHYFITCGRFRRSECGRPFIKCNDCGARFIEGNCSKTLEEWLAIKDCSLYKFLVSHQVIGPELSFSPPVLFQVLLFPLILCLFNIIYSVMFSNINFIYFLFNGLGLDYQLRKKKTFFKIRRQEIKYRRIL